jgi:hypothetical protein
LLLLFQKRKFISFAFCSMAQKTIVELLDSSTTLRATPYPGSLTAKVVKLGHTAKFKDANGGQAEMLNFSLADNTGAILATMTDKSQFRQIREGRTLLIREFIVKNGKFALSSRSKVMVKPDLAIPEDIEQQAKHLILPPSPSKKICDILTSPVKTLATTQGEVKKVCTHRN